MDCVRLVQTVGVNTGKSLITGEKYNHPNSLPTVIMDEIKPIFKDLAQQDLLKKCLHGRTQNPNESLHNVIWSRIPKNVFVGIYTGTLHFGVFDAISTFNEGNVTKCLVLQLLGLSAGHNTVEAMKRLDRERLRSATVSLKISPKKPCNRKGV